MRLVEVVGYEADEARISHFYKWERFNEKNYVFCAVKYLEPKYQINKYWKDSIDIKKIRL